LNKVREAGEAGSNSGGELFAVLDVIVTSYMGAFGSHVGSAANGSRNTFIVVA